MLAQISDDSEGSAPGLGPFVKLFWAGLVILGLIAMGINLSGVLDRAEKDGRVTAESSEYSYNVICIQSGTPTYTGTVSVEPRLTRTGRLELVLESGMMLNFPADDCSWNSRPTEP